MSLRREPEDARTPIRNEEGHGQRLADLWSDVLGELEFYGLNKGEIDDFFSRIDAVTVEQANAVARKYYSDAALQFVLIGNAAKVEPMVKKYAAHQKTVPIKAPGFVN